MRSELATYTIPDLTGHRLDEARRILETQGFKFREVSEDGTNNGVRVVTRTVPAADTHGPIVRRPEVTVYHRADLSSAVPSILGSDCNGARQILERAKFALTRCEPGAATHQYQPGKINRQEPGPRADAPRYRAVTAWTEPPLPDRGTARPGDVKPPPGGTKVPPQPELPRVPNLIALTCAAATERLQALDARLDCGQGKTTGQFKPGQINDQQPAAGQLMPKDRLVRVATEPERGVPDLRGQSCAAARGTLANAGMQLGACVPGNASRNYAPGQINDQTPAPGQRPPANRLVQAWTERDVGVPEVRGQSCASAQKILSGVGLQLGACAAGNVTGRYPPGQINEQTPAPGQPPPGNRMVQAWTEREPAVPDLRGLTCDQGRSLLAQRRLVLASCDRGKPDGATPSGRINAQEPRAGSSPPADRRLQAWTAPPQVVVPNVEGQNADAARSRLADSTLQAQFAGPLARLGARVRTQQPLAGSKVEEGSQVTLQMEFVVPDLRGRTCAEAGKLAAEYGLKGVACVASRLADSGNRVGTVYAQEPAAATALATPAEIKVQVVTEALHTVPELVDQTAAEALRRLSQVGLRAQFDVSGTADRRVVVAALPPAGAQVEASSTVMLTTVALVKVPALTGKTCTEAQETLSQLGLNFVCSSRWPVPLLAPVIDTQAPPSPTPVRAGSTVTGTATPDWRRGSIFLAALLAGTALLVPVSRRAIFRRWRGPGHSGTTPTPPTLPAFSVRGEPDPSPRITVRADNTPLDWPALNVRGEAGTPRYFLNLSDREDDDGPT